MTQQMKNIGFGLLSAITLLLVGCNDFSVTTAANGGVTGTGITMGRITNFGSIFVNGIRFDVDNATFIRDGKSSQGQIDFSVGEFITIKGRIDPDRAEGVAMKVTFNDILKGEVTNISADGVSLEILGQLVHTDPLTIFHDFNNVSDLLVGNFVEVSGVLGANGHIVATNLKLIQDSFQDGISTNVLKGIISNINTDDKTFEIQNTQVEYTDTQLINYEDHVIHNDQNVEVISNSSIDNIPLNNTPKARLTLTATSLRLIDEQHDLTNHESANIEGLVSRFVSATNFDINGLPVTTNVATRYVNGNVNTIKENAFIRLEGIIHTSGVLLAERITFQSKQETIEAEGVIQIVDLVKSEITLPTGIIVVNSSTLMINQNNHNGTTFSLSDLLPGDQIKVKGIKLNDGRLLATRLDKQDAHPN